ncbi:MAG TPA: hypothetical protein VFU04_01330 [Solirubrobacterales bacterium]|nr:hypothetical protein [Solirubrobacterales bacterium]
MRVRYRAVSESQPRTVVPLEAGAGPENPPCPACGEPLFGWIDAGPGLAGAVRRCESCGLGVIGTVSDAEDALRELDRLRDGKAIRIANRGGFSAWIGTAGWAGLEPDARYLFTPEAVRRLVAHRDQVVTQTRWLPGPGIRTMWQTILNGFTFGRNVAIGAFGKGDAIAAERSWQRRLDALISAVVALPALAAAVPMEAIAAALGKGSTMETTTEVL